MSDYADAGPEPSLAEMIADPVMQAVMLRDRVTEEALWGFLRQAWLGLTERAAMQATQDAGRGSGASGTAGGTVPSQFASPCATGGVQRRLRSRSRPSTALAPVRV
ncbi:MAG: hypothetical protein HYR63_27335 [Proteobacteria bacterium]|nr:hypothetical protein [Pseudomonadota bacterium]